EGDDARPVSVQVPGPTRRARAPAPARSATDGPRGRTARPAQSCPPGSAAPPGAAPDGRGGGDGGGASAREGPLITDADDRPGRRADTRRHAHVPRLPPLAARQVLRPPLFVLPSARRSSRGRPLRTPVVRAGAQRRSNQSP